jgi:hypothetical protein
MPQGERGIVNVSDGKRMRRCTLAGRGAALEHLLGQGPTLRAYPVQLCNSVQKYLGADHACTIVLPQLDI